MVITLSSIDNNKQYYPVRSNLNCNTVIDRADVASVQFPEPQGQEGLYPVFQSYYNDDETQLTSDIPKYLNRWMYGDGNPLIETESIAGNGLLPVMASDPNHNLNVYGDWGETKLIRIIVMPYQGVTLPSDVVCNVQIMAFDESDNSYTYNSDTNPHPLNENYKCIVDGNTSNAGNLGEIGSSGDYGGCLKNVNGVSYASYYGVKYNDAVTVIASVNSPYYFFHKEHGSDTGTYGLLFSGLHNTETGGYRQFFTTHEDYLRLFIGGIRNDMTHIFYVGKKWFHITVTANPSEGGRFNYEGTFYNTPFEHYLQYGDFFKIEAIPNSGYAFVNWTENGEILSRYTGFSVNSVDRDVSLQANFVGSTINISVSANPTGYGTVSGGGSYSQGDICTVNAVAVTGYEFVNWTENGSTVSTQASYSFTVQYSRTLIANFRVKEYKIAYFMNYNLS